MNSIIDALNAGASALVGLLLKPFMGFSPFLGLFVVSALAGVVLLYLYGKVSAQKKIRVLKREILANLQDVLLFRHDVGIMLRAQLRLFKCSGLYFAYAFPALIVLMIPCLLVLAQLNLYFGVRALQPGETAMLKIKLSSPAKIREVSLESSPGLEVSPAVRSPADGEVAWRVRALEPVAGWYRLQVGNGQVRRSLGTGGKLEPVVSHSWLERLMYPASGWRELSAMAVDELSFSYPAGEVSFMGIGLNWILVFFVVSLLAGLVASRFLKVEI